MKLFFDSINRAIRAATVRDTGVVFVGNIISSVLGALFFFLLAHKGGPYIFGVFSVSIAIAVTVVDLFDIAIDNAVLNFASRSEARSAVLRTGLVRKCVLSIGASILLWISAPLLVGLLGKSEILQTIRMAIWFIPIKSFYSFVKTIFQASRQFHFDAGIEIFSSSIRIIGFLFMFVSNISVLTLALWTYMGSLAVSAILGLPLILPALRKKEGTRPDKEFTSFQSWMTVSFAASAISSRLDVLFLTRMTSLETVGWYQAAFRLFMPIQQLAGSLTRVFAPRLASFHSVLQARSYLRKSLILTGFLSGAILFTMPIFPWAVQLLYGWRFQETVPIAYGLVPFFMIFLFSTPWWSVLLYFHSQAKKFAQFSVFGLLLQLVLFPSMITLFGVAGAAAALLFSNFVLTVLVARASKI